jgi:alpha-galactosidase
LTKFLNDGKDAYPLIDRWIENDAERYWRSDEYLAEPWNDQMSKAAVEMYRLYGLFPVGDTTRSVSPWWFHTDLKTKEQWFSEGGPDSEVGWTMYRNRLKQRTQSRQTVYQNENAKILDIFPAEMSEEALAPFIASMVTGRETQAILNVANNGAIEGVPDDAMVELVVTLRDKKIIAPKPDRLPNRLTAHVLMPRLRRMERVLQAYRDGDRMSLILGIMEDHRTTSFRQAEELVDDLLSQSWNSELQAHYR